MDYTKYQELVNYYFEKDNREINYQNRIVIPLLEDILPYDIVDVSTLYQNWHNIDRGRFAGESYTPDILVADQWQLLNDNKKQTEYKALIEIKTPSASDRRHAENEVAEYLTKNVIVILTDCVTWEIFQMGEDKKIVFYFEEKHDENITYRRKIIKDSYPKKVATKAQKRKISWKQDKKDEQREMIWGAFRELIKSVIDEGNINTEIVTNYIKSELDYIVYESI